ncbi:hypothetical protein FGO68_gene8166 [Halteria grandinella]|uniref:Uncharacterized protein n=1 Tax=Halteria grandinella TaxID=5974 RepID=A0A8J8T6E2_HALGN|nr:hypothetical protein FGO68_gene8166 [Halteria grandinella]
MLLQEQGCLLSELRASLLVGQRSTTVSPLPNPILLQGILFSSMVLLASIVEGASLRQLVETTPMLQFSLSNVSKVYSKLCLFSLISYSAAFPLGACSIDDSLLLSKVLKASRYQANGFQCESSVNRQ